MFKKIYETTLLIMLIFLLIVSPFISIIAIVSEDYQIDHTWAFHIFSLIDAAILLFYLFKLVRKCYNKPLFWVSIILCLIIIFATAFTVYSFNDMKERIYNETKAQAIMAAEELYKNFTGQMNLPNISFSPNYSVNEEYKDNNCIYVECCPRIISDDIDQKYHEGNVQLIQYMDSIRNQIGDICSQKDFPKNYSQNDYQITIYVIIDEYSGNNGYRFDIYNQYSNKYELNIDSSYCTVWRDDDIIYIDENIPLEENMVYLNRLPYEGMQEKYLYYTKLGEPYSVETNTDFYKLKYGRREKIFRYNINSIPDLPGKSLAVITVRYNDNGEGHVYSIHYYPD